MDVTVKLETVFLFFCPLCHASSSSSEIFTDRYLTAWSVFTTESKHQIPPATEIPLVYVLFPKRRGTSPNSANSCEKENKNVVSL